MKFFTIDLLKRQNRRQLLAALIVNLTGIFIGISVSWIAPMISLLEGEDSPVGDEPMSEEEISWLSAVVSISPIVALPVSAWSSEYFGRKITTAIIAIPAIINWILIYFAQNFYHLLIARILVGFSTGMTFSLVPIYVNEISHISVRGQLGSILTTSINLGSFLALVLGSTLSYHHFAIAGLCLPVIFFLTFILMPETPDYLVRKGNLEKAVRSIVWLREETVENAQKEVKTIQEELAQMADSTKTAKLKDLFRDRGTIKGLIIAITLFGGQQASGFSVVATYTPTIFELANSSLLPNVASMIVSAIQITAALSATLVIDRIGRRTLLIISITGMMISHLAFGIFFLLQDQHYDISSFSWLPLCSLSSYVIFYVIGMGPVTYVLVTEIVSSDVVSLTLSISMIFVFVISSATLKFFPFITSQFGSYTSFFILAAFCATTLTLTLCLVPETKGRSKIEIFEELNCRKNRDQEETSSVAQKSKNEIHEDHP